MKPFILLGTLAAFAQSSVILTPRSNEQSGYNSIAYFASWAIYARQHFVDHLPVDHITHVIYSFADVNNKTGEVHLTDSWADAEHSFGPEKESWQKENLFGNLRHLYLLKQKNRNLKVLLSIGGWSFSHNFHPVVIDKKKRDKFVSSAVKFVTDLGLDGLDIDYEYPENKKQADGYLALLTEIRAALDALQKKRKDNYRFSLMIAVSANPKHFKQIPLAKIDKVIDFWNIMAYDFAGTWDKVSGHHTNLNPIGNFSVKEGVQGYLTAGIPAKKINLGMALYGRSFADTDGPGSEFARAGKGTWEDGVLDYKELPLEGSVVLHDDKAGASYSFDPETGEMVSYDTPDDARAKAEYVKSTGLGGVFFWESNGDYPVTDNRSLIGTMVGSFGGVSALKQANNQLSYPESKYKNMRDYKPQTNHSSS